MTKSEAVNVMKNSDKNKKVQNIVKLQKTFK